LVLEAEKSWVGHKVVVFADDELNHGVFLSPIWLTDAAPMTPNMEQRSNRGVRVQPIVRPDVRYETFTVGTAS
jgi:hypothetical protein